MRYVIVTGGPLPDKASGVIDSFNSDDSLLIACDGGCDFLARHNTVPDLVVGDLDSITSEGLEFIKANNIPVEKYPVEKDWTDSEIALNKAGQEDEVIFVCPLSARIDHVIANLCLALTIRGRGTHIVVTDGDTYCYPLNGEDEVSFGVTGFDGDVSVSLIPMDFDTPVTGVTTEGLYYPLENAELKAGSSFSFSNHPSAGVTSAKVSIKSGRLTVAVSRAV